MILWLGKTHPKHTNSYQIDVMANQPTPPKTYFPPPPQKLATLTTYWPLVSLKKGLIKRPGWPAIIIMMAFIGNFLVQKWSSNWNDRACDSRLWFFCEKHMPPATKTNECVPYRKELFWRWYIFQPLIFNGIRTCFSFLGKTCKTKMTFGKLKFPIFYRKYIFIYGGCSSQSC